MNWKKPLLETFALVAFIIGGRYIFCSLVLPKWKLWFFLENSSSCSNDKFSFLNSNLKFEHETDDYSKILVAFLLVIYLSNSRLDRKLVLVSLTKIFNYLFVCELKQKNWFSSFILYQIFMLVELEYCARLLVRIIWGPVLVNDHIQRPANYTFTMDITMEPVRNISANHQRECTLIMMTLLNWQLSQKSYKIQFQIKIQPQTFPIQPVVRISRYWLVVSKPSIIHSRKRSVTKIILMTC